MATNMQDRQDKKADQDRPVPLLKKHITAGASTNYQVTKLSDIEQSPFTHFLFKNYCRLSYTSENTDFLAQAKNLLATVKFECEANPKMQHKILEGAQKDFKNLYSGFINENSSRALNLSGPLREKFSSEYAGKKPAFKIATFQEAVDEIESMVESDPLPRFIKSPDYIKSQLIFSIIASIQTFKNSNSKHAPKKPLCNCLKKSLTALQQIYENFVELEKTLIAITNGTLIDFNNIGKIVANTLAVHQQLFAEGNELDKKRAVEESAGEDSKATVINLLNQLHTELLNVSTPTMLSKQSPQLRSMQDINLSSASTTARSIGNSTI